MLAAATLLAVLLPVGLVLQWLAKPSAYVAAIGLAVWLSGSVHGLLLLVDMALGGFVLTQLVQSEYSQRTIINMLTAPVARPTFLAGKLLIWALWSALTACLTGAVLAVGIYLLFPAEANAAAWQMLAAQVTQALLLNLGVLSPMAAIVIWQRASFYPSMLYCFFAVLLSSLQYNALPVLPFMAVGAIYRGYAVQAGAISLIIWIIISLTTAFAVFRRQIL